MQPDIDLRDMRKDYDQQGVSQQDLAADPVAQFEQWLAQAVDDCPAPWLEPNAMTLATCGKDGLPAARVVLLKGLDAEGFVFFTNYNSLKGQQLADNPQAALDFHWPWQGRQVVVRGAVEKISREATEQYFHSRPHQSQLGAVASHQSQVVASRTQLEQAFSQAQQSYEQDQVPCPEEWGGYRLKPVQIEFWQGRRSRMHDRLRYRRDTQGNWLIERLSP